MKYLKKFLENSQYQAFKDSSDFITPNVSFVIDENKVFYNPKMPEYVTFTISQDGYEEFGMTELQMVPVTVPKGTTFAEFANDYEHYLNIDCVVYLVGDDISIGMDEYRDQYGEELVNRVIQNGDNYFVSAC